MSLQWCRLYAETVDDAKLKLLAFEDRWHFIALLCLKTQGVLDSTRPELLDRVVAAKLGLGLREADEVRRRLVEVDLVAQDWQPLAWDRRQFKSDDVTERVRRHRQARRESSPTPPPTESEPDTDTDTEQKRSSERFRNVSETLPGKRARKRCPEDFEIPSEALEKIRAECPDVDLEFETRRFRDYEFATAKSDWLATWRNWMRKAQEAAAKHRKPRPTRYEELMARVNAPAEPKPVNSLLIGWTP